MHLSYILSGFIVQIQESWVHSGTVGDVIGVTSKQFWLYNFNVKQSEICFKFLQACNPHTLSTFTLSEFVRVWSAYHYHIRQHRTNPTDISNDNIFSRPWSWVWALLLDVSSVSYLRTLSNYILMARWHAHHLGSFSVENDVFEVIKNFTKQFCEPRVPFATITTGCRQGKTALLGIPVL